MRAHTGRSCNPTGTQNRVFLSRLMCGARRSSLTSTYRTAWGWKSSSYTNTGSCWSTFCCLSSAIIIVISILGWADALRVVPLRAPRDRRSGGTSWPRLAPWGGWLALRVGILGGHTDHRVGAAYIVHIDSGQLRVAFAGQTRQYVQTLCNFNISYQG